MTRIVEHDDNGEHRYVVHIPTEDGSEILIAYRYRANAELVAEKYAETVWPSGGEIASCQTF
jgi:hypothetical protein